MLVRPLRGSVAPAALLLLLTTLAGGCSRDDGCVGQEYDVDLSAEGAPTPIDAVDAWLAAPEGFTELPPKDDWIVQGGGAKDAPEVELLNEDTGKGWWLHVVRTDAGGYVVDQATNDWTACEDVLS